MQVTELPCGDKVMESVGPVLVEFANGGPLTNVALLCGEMNPLMLEEDFLLNATQELVSMTLRNDTSRTAAVAPSG